MVQTLFRNHDSISKKSEVPPTVQKHSTPKKFYKNLEKPRGKKKPHQRQLVGQRWQQSIEEKQMNKVNLAEGHITLAHLPKRSVHSRQRGSN
jgi:hypothetical protein